MASIIKAPLRQLIKFVVVHPLSSIALVVLLGVGFFIFTNRVPQPVGALAGSSASSSPVVAKGNLPAPVATEDFMLGQKTFDADLVWGALGDELHSSLSTQGGSKEALQDQLDQYKQEGRQLEEFTYVGGYAPGTGKSFYFYVASIRRPELGGQPDQVFFAFTVDGQGKIASVE